MNYGFIGAAIGACAELKGCEKAPLSLEKTGKINFQSILSYEGCGKDYQALANYYSKLGKTVFQMAFDYLPMVIGGDHSCAIGTWKGLHKYYEAQGKNIGLIWVDAHMDSHTPESTPSGNIHGMPLAVLLGYGDTILTNVLGYQAKLKPENITLIGMRSYETEEATLLESLGVKIYYMEEIIQRGIEQIIITAFNRLAERGPVGLSIDMDAFDPIEVPGVGTPEPKGISPNDFISSLHKIDLSLCCGVEIAEYNPNFDRDDITQRYIMRLVEVFKSGF